VTQVVSSDTIDLIADVHRMLGRLGVSYEDAQKRVHDAIMGVLASALRPDASLNPLTGAFRAMVDAESRGSGVSLASAAPAPTGLAPNGAVFRSSGKKAVGANGEAVELGTWINPTGEAEAVRLTKETGVIHYVDPKDGQVKSLGELPTDMLASAAVAPAATPALEKIPVGGEAAPGAYESARK